MYLITKPSHGRIAQFSNLAGTLAYIPDANYDGKDEFTFKVHDGTVFSKDAKVSIKIQNNVKSSNDQVKRGDQQPSKQDTQPSKQDTQTTSNEQKTNDEKSKNDTPPPDSNQQSSSSTQDNGQQKNDQKAEEQQSVQPDTPKSDTAPSGDSQPNS